MQFNRKLTNKTIITIGLIIGCLNISMAQDPYFSQFYLNPVYMNPAYAGTMKVPRAGVQYRNQWPGFDKAYTTYFASYDAYLPKISSGIAFLAFNDVQGNGLYTESNFKLAFSKEIRLNRYWTMYGSISGGIQSNQLNYNQLIFQDALDEVFGNHHPTAETIPDQTRQILPDFGAGILIFNHQIFWGFAADHLSSPVQSFYSGYNHKIYRKYTTHLEVSLPWYRPGILRKFCTFNPNVIVQAQGNDLVFNLGMYANRKGVSVGIWNRMTNEKSHDLIFMAGFIGKQFKTALTYDVNLRGAGLKSQGAVEVSVSFLLKDPGAKSIFPFYEIPGEWDIR